MLLGLFVVLLPAYERLLGVNIKCNASESAQACTPQRPVAAQARESAQVNRPGLCKPLGMLRVQVRAQECREWC
jgi:hypothetical protein